MCARVAEGPRPRSSSTPGPPCRRELAWDGLAHMAHLGWPWYFFRGLWKEHQETQPRPTARPCLSTGYIEHQILKIGIKKSGKK